MLGTLKHVDRVEYRTVSALQAYLRQAVVNRIRDLIRRSRRRGVAVEPDEELPDPQLSPLERAILGERLDEFLEALRRLRPIDDRSWYGASSSATPSTTSPRDWASRSQPPA